MNIVSKKLYSPFEYLKLVTGKDHIISGNDTIACVEEILEREGYYYLWNFPLDEMEEIIEHDLRVVLVDCLVLNEETKKMEHEYRWFEVETEE